MQIESKKIIQGLHVRTNNKKELSPNGNIGNLVQEYFQNNIASKLKDRLNPGITYCVYTNYATDECGDYDYYIGEAVAKPTKGINLPHITIQDNIYKKITTEQGPLPIIVQKAWAQIWQDKNLKNQRLYLTDFEVYDQRAKNPNNAIIDIYVGIKKQ